MLSSSHLLTLSLGNPLFLTRSLSFFIKASFFAHYKTLNILTMIHSVQCIVDVVVSIKSNSWMFTCSKKLFCFLSSFVAIVCVQCFFLYVPSAAFASTPLPICINQIGIDFVSDLNSIFGWFFPSTLITAMLLQNHTHQFATIRIFVFHNLHSCWYLIVVYVEFVFFSFLFSFLLKQKIWTIQTLN